MKRDLLAWILVTALCRVMSTTTMAPAAEDPAGEIGPDEYDVFAFLADQGTVVLQKTTLRKISEAVLEREDLLPGKNAARSDKALIEDYAKKNAREYLLDVPAMTARRVTVITEQDHRELFKTIDSGWSAFRKKYGHATLVRFSRVGFNADRSLAVVYKSEVADPEMGSGMLIVLERSVKNGPWKIRTMVSIWIA